MSEVALTSSESDVVLAETVRWLERAVIGLNLCPFAKAVHAKKQIRYTVCLDDSPETLLNKVIRELQFLVAAEPAETDTTLIIHPNLFTDFLDFNDFLAQFKMMRKMGPLENILGMIPGMSNVQGLSVDEKQLKRTEAIVLSMTSEERTRPDLLNARRRQRIARGSGSSVTEVNDLLQRFNQMRKMMKNAGKMKKMMAQMARMKN